MSNQFVPVLALFNTELSAAITASATTAYVKSVTSIPTAPFHAILDAGSSSAELVKVTAVTTATKALTIVRAQASTTARAHPEDTLVHACEMDSTMLHLDAMTRTLAGSSAQIAMQMTVTDDTSISTGRNAGLYINYTINADKTGGEISVFSARYTIANDTGDSYAYHALMNVTSGKDISSNIGLFYGYMSDLGSGTIGNAWAVKLDRVTTTQASSRDMFLGFKAHGGAGRAKTVLYIEGTSDKMAEQFIMFAGIGETSSDLLQGGINVGSGYTCVAALRVGHEAIIGGGVTTQYYIPLYTAD